MESMNNCCGERYVEKHFHNRIFATLDEVENTLQKALNEWHHNKRGSQLQDELFSIFLWLIKKAKVIRHPVK